MRTLRGTTLACWAVAAMAALAATGCGTTRWSDTSRTATEQMLLSTAVDRAISDIDFTPLAGKDVFLDDQYLKGTVDSNYIIATLRQQLLASGCLLKSDRKEATYIVEARAGGVGTNRHDVMMGVPAFSVPSVVPTANTSLGQMPSSVPEIPFAKMTDQKGLAKIAVFAYNQKTGLAVWQSGAFPIVTNAKDGWIMGMGPVQRGTIYGGTKFAGSGLIFSGSRDEDAMIRPRIPVAAEAVFAEPEPEPAAEAAVGAQPEGKAPPPVAATAAATAPTTPATAGPAATPDSKVTPAAHAAPIKERAASNENATATSKLFPHGSPRALIGRLPSTEKEAAKKSAGNHSRTARGEKDTDREGGFSLFSPSTWFGRESKE